jgi:hypothetical protein
LPSANHFCSNGAPADNTKKGKPIEHVKTTKTVTTGFICAVNQSAGMASGKKSTPASRSIK